MKKILLVIGSLFVGVQAQAQAANIHCQIFFNNAADQTKAYDTLSKDKATDYFKYVGYTDPKRLTQWSVDFKSTDKKCGDTYTLLAEKKSGELASLIIKEEVLDFPNQRTGFAFPKENKCFHSILSQFPNSELKEQTICNSKGCIYVGLTSSTKLSITSLPIACDPKNGFFSYVYEKKT